MAQYLGVSQIETDSVSVTGGVCGPGVDSANTHLTFDLPLRTSLVPKYCRGSGTPTFTRASNAYVADHEGILRLALSGEARFQGARRVANGLRYTENFTNVVWEVYGGTGTLSVTSGKTDPLGGSTAWEITPSGGATGFLQNVTSARLSLSGNYPAGSVACSSVWMRVTSGTKNVTIYAQGDDATSATVVVDTTWRRYCYVDSTCGGKSLYFILQYSGDLQVWHPQLELLTGASNQSPSEYVSSDVLSAPYHGAGVDGVKYFDTENGNSLVGNVVVEATGDAIADDTLKGYTSEGQRTNRCLYSEDFTNAAWVKTNCTISADSIAAPNGATTADTLTATGANATCIQDLGVVASLRKAGSVYLKRKTGTGNIDLTMDGGASWTTVAVTSSWTRFELKQELADEDFGIRLVTNGDEVYAWGAQVESVHNVSTNAPELRSSYIATTSTAVTHNTDSLTYVSTTNVSEGPLTTYHERSRPVAMYNSASASAPSLSLGNYSDNAYLGCDVYGDGGNILTSWPTVWGLILSNNFSTTVDQIYKTAVTLAADGRTVNYYLDGSQTGASSGVSADTKSAGWAGAKIYIGNNNSANDHYHFVRNVRIWSAVMPIRTDGTVASQISG